MAWMAFLACMGAGALYFGLSRRRFDLLTIAFVGASFYLSPLVIGRVIKMGAGYDPTIPAPVHLIGCAFVIALIVGGMIAARMPEPASSTERPLDLSGWFLGIAVLGLTVAVLTSRGALFNMDKVQALREVGYWYAGFEIAACLACLSAVAERHWWRLAFGTALLCIDLLVGFRVFFVLAAVGIPVVLHARAMPLRLYTKLPSYGLIAIGLVAAMLLVHSARFAIFSKFSDTIAMTDAAAMRGDIIQYQDAVDGAISKLPGTKPALDAPDGSKPSLISKLPWIVFNLFEKSEPFTIQATLVETVNQGLVCKPGNILKSLRLLALPGFNPIGSNSYPPTFYDEFQPILFPAIDYGLGGNIFAEVLCRFGYAGVAVFIVLLVGVLIGLQSQIWSMPIIFRAPLVLGGVILAFYIHRNDVHYTLVLLRQTALIFAGAWLFAWTQSRLLQRYPKPGADEPL